MDTKELLRLTLDVTTVIAILVTIFLVLFVISKKTDLEKNTRVSGKTYLILVGLVEVFYTIGILCILTALGFNIIERLQNLEFGKVFSAINAIDMTKLRFTGIIGWIGLVINLSVAFIAPAYLLIAGKHKLPKPIYVAAWTEIGLEVLIALLIIFSFIFG